MRPEECITLRSLLTVTHTSFATFLLEFALLRRVGLNRKCHTHDDDNELIVLETIHHFVEVLDRYFGNVCELDLIFNFHKAYHILDELLITGELQEPSKKAILRVTAAQDALMEGTGDSKVSDSKYEI